MPRTKKLLKDPTSSRIRKPRKQPVKRMPRQKTLPGMTDAKIAVLEHAALVYAEVRDERMNWTKKEVEAKQRVQKLMHKQNRTHYQRANIEISLEPENEKVIVRVKAPTEPASEPQQPPVPDEVPAETGEEVPDAEYGEGSELEDQREEDEELEPSEVEERQS